MVFTVYVELSFSAIHSIGSLQIKVVMGKHKDDQSKLEDAGKVNDNDNILFS